MKEQEPQFEKKDEKPFERGGFQEDGTYIQEISRMQEGPDGVRRRYPPKEGQRIVTGKDNPHRVVEVTEMFEYDGRFYFRAEIEEVEERNNS